MDALGDKIEVIRENGIGLGLSDMEIDLCMFSAMRELKEPHDQTRKRIPKRKIPRKRKYLRVLCLVGVVLFVVFSIAYTMLLFSPSTQRWIEKKVEPWIYPVSQNWRLATLGVTKTFDLSPWYEAECFISNPFVMPETVPCDECAKVTKEHELKEITTSHFETTYYGRAQPFVLRGSHSIVSFDDLQALYNDNIQSFEHFDAASNKLKVSPVDLSKITDLLSKYTREDIQKTAAFHVEWVTDGVNPSRMTRKLFPRQSFIPAKSEVNLHKTISITSPQADTFLMTRDQRDMGNKWYVQGSGSRTLTFIPDIDCQQECKQVTVTLNAGDVMFYGTLYYKVESAPVPDNEDINIAFIGTFS